MPLREYVYFLSKRLGGFRLASHLTRKSLTILCYHGISFQDEHRFRPKLFQSAALFEERMRLLKALGYQTLNLDEGMQRLHAGTLERKDVVITVDDGFDGIHTLGAPILESLGLSATIYVTTYYVTHNNPVFRLALQYLFWKTSLADFSTEGLWPDAPAWSSTKRHDGSKTEEALTAYGETELDEPSRQALLNEVGRRLRVDMNELRQNRRLTLMSSDQIRDLAERGFDIQLHTHRHHFPDDPVIATRELEENRAILEPLAGKRLTHLCYPSGEWTPSVWPNLDANNVATATTCEPGLNTAATSPFALKRFLDFETTPQIVFEAELSGYASLLRQAASRG